MAIGNGLNVEKSPYQAANPLVDALNGAPEPDDLGEDLEVEIEGESPQEVETSSPQQPAEFGSNLATLLDEAELTQIANDLVELYEEDDKSRQEWRDLYVQGIKLLGLNPEKKSDPWDGACNVVHPMLMEAALRFQAETIVETFPASGPVQTRVLGKETPEKLAAARRVKEDMNYKLTTVMKEYRSEHERALWTLAVGGNAFKKVYEDPSLGRPVSLFVPPEDIVMNYGAPTVGLAERVTHKFKRSKNELAKAISSGFYREVDLVAAPSVVQDDVTAAKDAALGVEEPLMLSDDNYDMLEMHVNYVLPDKIGDGELASPYIITIERNSQKVLSIYRNWREGDPLKQKTNYFVHYQYVPGHGSYAFGLIHIIGGYADSATTILQLVVDAGTLANMQGGWKTKSVRVKNENDPWKPGEWRDVDVLAGTLKDSMLPLAYKEPSATLVALLDKIVDAGQRAASNTDLKVAEMKQEAPVGTTLALLERTLKPMTAVQARVHAAMSEEFQLLKDLFKAKAPQQYDYEADSPTPVAPQQDYAFVEVIPVSDPNATTMTARIAQMQAMTQMAQQSPQNFDQTYLYRWAVDILGIKNPEKFVPDKGQVPQRDPVTENSLIMSGAPVKAYPSQDHNAHLKVHKLFLNDQRIQTMLQGMQNGAAIIGALQAHIAEHMGMKYRAEMVKALGVELPDPSQPLPPEVENQLAAVMAMAADQVAQNGQMEAVQEATEEQMKDPAYKLQEEDIKVKAAEVLRKAMRDQEDIRVKDDANKIAAAKAANEIVNPAPPPVVPSKGPNA